MAVDMDGQSGGGFEDLAYGDVPPPEVRVVDDDPGGRVDAVAGGEAEGEDGPARAVRLGQPGQPVREVAQQRGSAGEPARGAAGDGGVRAARADRVRPAVLGDDPAAQVHERDGGVGDGDMGSGDQIAAGVDPDGDVGAAEPFGSGGLRALPHQPAGQQPADVAGDRRRGKAGEAGDVGAGDRAVVEDRAQDGAGAGDPAGGSSGGDVGAAQRGGAAGGRGQTLHRCLPGPRWQRAVRAAPGRGLEPRSAGAAGRSGLLPGTVARRARAGGAPAAVAQGLGAFRPGGTPRSTRASGRHDLASSGVRIAAWRAT
ncbi:hypothetical protein AN221_37335 [Streptomyces nanshensis]|uniref:Uncharacterized protein n=1 Tax=Streptomyces nanshensis TaxID=518642 RepID=A0A1E7LHI9_9ACTN|nr:hypothetical protein AN221_37335 [Streptomyces nanshensis]